MLHRDKAPSLFFYLAIWNRGVSDPKEHSKPPPAQVRLPPVRYLVLRSGRQLHFPRISDSLKSLEISITLHCASLGASWTSPSMAKKTGLGSWRAGTSVPSRVLSSKTMLIPVTIILATWHQVIAQGGTSIVAGTRSALLSLLSLLLLGVELTSSCRHCYPSWPVAVLNS